MSDDEMFIWMTKQNAKQLIRVFVRWISLFDHWAKPKDAIRKLSAFEVLLLGNEEDRYE